MGIKNIVQPTLLQKTAYYTTRYALKNDINHYLAMNEQQVD